MRVILIIALLICKISSQEDGAPSEPEGSEKQPEPTTESSDYEEEDDGNNCEDWGLFEFLNKILCIFKMIIGLITGNPDPCCPFELPSFG
ncbi:Hypothetical protein NTJ_15939 [Nesidiocoris tenuis]|uniref:Uncharacterized protein n=1 Tax=Nesidiocoris tenuis TaxID=355587 RepID=A0ABN7BFH1_9HEMI|nr:Hypothetical protein NTJ_15939 [Nesidiocoris tenuis]